MEIEIVQDECAENPCKEFDFLTKFVIFHRRYSFGNCEDFKTPEEFKEFMKRNRAGFFFPLYMYDHSGITISLSPFSCPWDSGQVGWVFVTKTAAVKEFGRKVTKEQVYKTIQSEVNLLDLYFKGEVYGYQIKNDEDKIIDSCYGFYGQEYVEQAAQNALEQLTANANNGK
jgi:hypothetical protein